MEPPEESIVVSLEEEAGLGLDQCLHTDPGAVTITLSTVTHQSPSNHTDPEVRVLQTLVFAVLRQVEPVQLQRTTMLQTVLFLPHIWQCMLSWYQTLLPQDNYLAPPQ